MALTRTARGGGGNAVSATSIACSPSGTIPAGAIAVLIIGCDNSGASGVSPYSSISDSVGNTWTRRDTGTDSSGGAANDGSTLIFFTSLLTTQLLSSDTVTVSFGAVSVPSKAYIFEQVSADAGTPSYKTGATDNTGTGTTSTITTGTITNGDIVIAALALEWDTSDIPAGDADTTNGSWTAQINAASGATGTSTAQQVNSQTKIVTADGAQTYNVTSNPATDRVIGWIEIEELVTATAAAFRPIMPTEAIRRAARW